jgi:hypothetical protein
MVKNQAKIPHFWLRYFDKKTAPKLNRNGLCRLRLKALAIGLMFEDVLQIGGL